MLLIVAFVGWLASAIGMFFLIPSFYGYIPADTRLGYSAICGWFIGMISAFIAYLLGSKSYSFEFDFGGSLGGGGGKEIHIGDTILANHHSKTKKMGALHDVAGGKITFESDKLVFKPHAMNLDTSTISIRYKDIDHCESGPINNIIVKQKNGDSDMFVVYHKNRVISFINSLAG